MRCVQANRWDCKDDHAQPEEGAHAAGEHEHAEHKHLLEPRDLPRDVPELLQGSHVLTLLMRLEDEVGEIGLLSAQVAPGRRRIQTQVALSTYSHLGLKPRHGGADSNPDVLTASCKHPCASCA